MQKESAMADAYANPHDTPHKEGFLLLHQLVQPISAHPHQEARFIREITTTLATACATAKTADEVGHTLLEQTCLLLAAPAAALVLRDPLHGDAIVRLATGSWIVRCGTHLPAGVGLCGRVMDTRKIQMCRPARCSCWCEWPWLIDDIYSIVGAPLLHEQHLIGALVLGLSADIAGSALYLLTALTHLAASAFATLPWADISDA
jgi:GAF domain-containing protein